MCRKSAMNSPSLNDSLLSRRILGRPWSRPYVREESTPNLTTPVVSSTENRPSASALALLWYETKPLEGSLPSNHLKLDSRDSPTKELDRA